MSTAAELTERAEAQLLLADFVQAEGLARQALQRASYLGDDRLKDRAACVAIQALAETQRFAAASRLLKDSCGPRLEDAPPYALLLWLALALDTDARREAQRLLLALLDLRRPGGDTGWSRRQYLQLAHLYVFEVLLRELREAAEVMRWVEETELPLTAEERQLLLAELAAEAEAAAAARRRQEQARQHAAQPPAEQRASSFDGGGGTRQGRSAALAAAAAERRGSRGEGQQRAQLPRTSQAGQPAGSAGGKGRSDGQGSAAAARAASAAAAAAAGADSEIVPAPPEEAEPAAAPGPLDWLARCQQQAAAALGAVLQPLLPAAERSSSAQESAEPVPADPAAALRLLGGTCLGAVLLYAAYAERQAIRRGAQRALRSAAAALGDLARMALSLQVNPLAASAPGWR
ncbi:hypothetical protein ABPG75_009315 [Micractinium tetrahymenae]